MQSLQTTVKRDAEKIARQVSVQFDTICDEALMANGVIQASGEVNKAALVESNAAVTPEEILARVPDLVRQAASRVVEEQVRNPTGWLEVVRKWQDLYEHIKAGKVIREIQIPAVEAQAVLNGFELVLQGKPVPSVESQRSSASYSGIKHASSAVPWDSICVSALTLYAEKVGASRYQMAKKRLPEVIVTSSNESDIQAGLKAWCEKRLKDVKPRTVRTQLDCMLSALKCVLPKLQAPYLKELKGVMQPRLTDRKSMPVQAIRAAMRAIEIRPVRDKVRKDYGGGASQFDDIAIEALAVLGMRPRELIQANSNALLQKTDVFGNQGLYFRIALAKNKASEREVPLSDGKREVLNVARLREMLEWQEKNKRSLAGSVTSLNTRFKQVTGSYTLYQMRHTWKDLAVHSNVDYELRERILGHGVRGVAAIYGSGIPLLQGLDALLNVRSRIYGISKDTD